MKALAALLTAIAFSPVSAFACVTAVEPQEEMLSPEAQVRTVQVTASAGCKWWSDPSEPWLTIVSRPASGSGTLTYRVTANPFTTIRGAQIYMPNFPVIVQQLGRETPKPFRGDINGDGGPDSFWRERSDANVALSSYGVWLSDPNAYFRKVETISGQNYGDVVAIGDFRGDGHAGFVLYEPVTRQVRIAFVGEAGQTTVAPVRQIISPAWQIIDAGDFDGDLKSDLLLRNVEEQLLSIWFMDGETLLAGPVVSPAPASRDWQVAGVADFDRDGRSDILFHNSRTGRLSTWFMDGATAVDTPLLASWKPLPWQVAAGDFDGDGNVDLVHYNRTTGELEYHLMDGIDVVAVSTEPDPNGVPWAPLGPIADMNRDGRDDVGFQWRAYGGDDPQYSVHYARTLGQTYYIATMARGLYVPVYRRSAASNDFNGDARSDLLLYNTADRSVSTWELDGTTVLRNSAFATVAPGWRIQTVSRFSGDGTTDLQLVNDGYLAVWELAGQAVLDSGEIDPAGGLVAGAADFDGDGNADLLIRDETTGDLEVMLLAGHTVRGRVAVGSTWNDDRGENGEIVGVGNFDVDQGANILLRYPSDGMVFVATVNLAGGPLTGLLLGPVSLTATPAGMVDLNGDGKEELLMREGNTVLAYFFDDYMADRGIIARTLLTTPADQQFQTAGDYDGDGLAEAIVRHNTSGAVTMWRRASSSSWTQTTFAHVISPQWVFIGTPGIPIP